MKIKIRLCKLFFIFLAITTAYADDASQTVAPATTPSAAPLPRTAPAAAVPYTLPAGDSHTLSSTVDQTDMQTATDQAVKNYKLWFGVDVSKADLKNVARKSLTDYNAKLKTCTPGNYKYVMIDDFYGHRDEKNIIVPMLDLFTTTIQGYQKGKCVLIIEPNTPDSTTCRLTQDVLDATASSKEGMGESTLDDEVSYDKLATLTATQCDAQKP